MLGCSNNGDYYVIGTFSQCCLRGGEVSDYAIIEHGDSGDVDYASGNREYFIDIAATAARQLKTNCNSNTLFSWKEAMNYLEVVEVQGFIIEKDGKRVFVDNSDWDGEDQSEPVMTYESPSDHEGIEDEEDEED
ncbi:MAG: hypothetical protein PHN89_03945 [Candidatus Pacebacteria bacterium]|nr:hypothetical protein [Candidatus Paceibacterota bacterium]